MKILFISDNFIPEVNAPANRTFEHCLRWVELGHDVTVITCAPNFPYGKVYKNYKNHLWKKENINGINVIRVWSFMTSNSGFFLRIFDHLSFMFSSLICSLFIKKIDIIISTTPQFFTSFSGYFASLIKRKKWVLEVRDLWPDSLLAVGVLKKNLIFNMLKKIEYFFYKRAAKIIVVSNSFMKILIENKIDKEKVCVILNGANRNKFYNRSRDAEIINKYNLSNHFCVGYIGTIGLAHHIETIILAAEKFKYLNKQVKFIIIGNGSERVKIQNLINMKELENVLMIEQVSHNEIVKYLSILDCSIVHLKKNKLFKTVIPSKIFESMAMGVPILHGVQGESAEIIIDNEIGEIFESENYENLFLLIKKFYNDKELLKKYKENCITSIKKFERTKLAEDMLNKILN